MSKPRKSAQPQRVRTRWLALSLLLIFVVYLGAANIGPPALGLWQDDGIYLCTAKSLAEGAGYRHIELPTRPLQTKYPILYPAVLAACFLISPEHSKNLFLLLAPTAFAAAGMVVFSALYLRRVFGAPRRLVVLVGVLAMLSPAIFSLVRFTMSDLLYGFLSAAALLLLDLKYAEAKTEKHRTLWLLASACVVALAVLTRLMGLALAGAALLTLIIKRRFRDVAFMILVVCLCVVPWWIWQAAAARANGAIQSSTLEAPELSYSLWLPHYLGQTVRVIYQNIMRAAFGIGYFQLAFPAQFTMSGIAEFSWKTVFIYLACYGSSLLILVGFWRSRASCQKLESLAHKKEVRNLCWRTVHLYAILYVGLMLVWPFEPFRFLVPWTPFLLYFLLTGLPAVGRDTARRLPVRAVVRVLYAALVVLFLTEDGRIVASTGGSFYSREIWSDCSEIRELERWLRANTGNGDVIASDRPAGVFLATGRKGQYFWPDTDPYSLYYGRDREWWNFYFLPGESESQFVYDEMRRHLSDTYVNSRVTFCVEHTGANAQAVALARIIAENPTWFELRYTSPGGAYKVYRVTMS